MTLFDEDIPNEKVWQSYVWHEDKCFFVSTIERDYDTGQGRIRGEETMVWEYDHKNRKRGEWIWQGGGVVDHKNVCHALVADGKIPDEDSKRYQDFWGSDE